MHLLVAPYNVPSFSGDVRAGMLLRLQGDDDIIAYSELAPLPEPGFSRETLEQAAEGLAGLDLAAIPANPDALEQQLETVPSRLPSLRWAIEVLLADYSAKRAGVSLAQWWCGASVRSSLAVNALLPRGISDADRRAIFASGYRSFKLKISPEVLAAEDDWAGNVARSLPAGAAVRLDGNRSFSAAAAKKLLPPIVEQLPVEYVEEPLQEPSRGAIADLKACGIPLGLDETLWLDRPLAAELLRSGEVAALILKPCMLGGYFGCKHLLELGRENSLLIAVTSTMEIGPAYAAGVHAALALENQAELLPCGFDTLKGYSRTFVPAELAPDLGYCRIGGSPGLGMSLAQFDVEWCELS